MTTMLPEDMVFQILLWLPVASLLRVKVVCKSWCFLIQSPDFISQHLQHHHLENEQENLIILDPSQCNDVRNPCFSLGFSLISGNSFQVSTNLDLPHRFQKPVFAPKIIASCNGIICLDHNFCTDISLWNPATKQFRLLPKPPVPVPSMLDGCLNFSFGFGFDGKTNDYKVVRIIIGDLFPFKAKSISRVDLYSLSMDSWTTIEDAVLPVNYIVYNPKAPFRDGIYCWVGRFHSLENDSMEYVILTFDITTQVFGTMLLPDINTTSAPMLALLKENIACIYSVLEPPEGENWHCKIWVLKKYGIKESWTKLYTIALESNAIPQGVSKNGKIVWIKRDRVCNDAKLCLCDPITQELKNLPYQGYLPHDLQVAVYKESLVSVKSANGATNGVTYEDLSEYCRPSAQDLALFKLGKLFFWVCLCVLCFFTFYL